MIGYTRLDWSFRRGGSIFLIRLQSFERDSQKEVCAICHQCRTSLRPWPKAGVEPRTDEQARLYLDMTDKVEYRLPYKIYMISESVELWKV